VRRASRAARLFLRIAVLSARRLARQWLQGRRGGGRRGRRRVELGRECGDGAGVEQRGAISDVCARGARDAERGGGAQRQPALREQRHKRRHRARSAQRVLRRWERCKRRERDGGEARGCGHTCVLREEQDSRLHRPPVE